jgi:ATP-dependent Lon protease
VAMTGEITLRGEVMAIGGLKEKLLAAHRVGIKTVILPRENKKDLGEVPSEIKKEIKFKFVTHVGDVLKAALEKDDIKSKEKKSRKISRRKG